MSRRKSFLFSHGFSSLSRRKILAARSREFYFSKREIFPPSGDSALGLELELGLE